MGFGFLLEPVMLYTLTDELTLININLRVETCNAFDLNMYSCTFRGKKIMKIAFT